MKIRCEILRVTKKGDFDFEYSLLAPDGKRYFVSVEGKLHELILKREGILVGRRVEYNTDGDIIRFLD